MTGWKGIKLGWVVRRLNRRFWAVALLPALVVVLCLLVILSTYASTRTFSVVSTTWGGKLVFEGELNDWRFDEAIICTLKDVPDFRQTPSTNDSFCAPSVYDINRVKELIVEWQDGTQINYVRTKHGSFYINVLSDQTQGFSTGTLIIIPQPVWSQHGALSFQGEAIIGGEMATGSRDYLIDGHWEARQSGFATSLFRDVTEVVKNGTLVRGSSVSFVGDSDRVVSYGHLTPANALDPGVNVVLLTDRGSISLRVNHFGLSESAVFSPDWIDTISSSPVLLALAVILSLLVGVVELLLTVSSGRPAIPMKEVPSKNASKVKDNA